jgi:uncharacterized SAM-binding protein YcdF (DUF218 family)
MFSRKYTFETKHTRSRRLMRNISLCVVTFCISFVLLCIYLPIYAKNQNEIASEAFFKKSPDLIAVYTGDSGRLDYTFKKIEKYPSATVFISGVYAKNSLKTLIAKQGTNLSVEEFIEQESHHIQLDYLARNTVENGISTYNYLRTLDAHKNVLIISSDYHILRIKMILETLRDEGDDYIFHFESIESNYAEVRNLKKLFKEVYKLLKTSTFLLFWNE